MSEARRPGLYSRRQMLARSCTAFACAWNAAATVRGARPPQPRNGAPAEELLGLVRMSEPNAAPFGRLLGTGLDARLFTDLSVLTPDTLVIPAEKFFVRTACPAAVLTRRDWSIKAGGKVRVPSDWSAAALQVEARPLGTALVECSGNGDPNNFGLMSAARWRGIPVIDLFSSLEPLPAATHVRVGGMDATANATGTSEAGAEWIFDLRAVQEAGAFFATHMNDEPLTPDHGGPIRLVVPGWYGCVCIKWVDRVEFVDESEPATSQMREFAERTHQKGVPALARDYLPATIDHAAMPIRIEKRRRDGRLFYRIVGIQWGGDTPIDAYQIQFEPGQPFVAVERCPRPASTSTWSLWTHDWRPAAPGRYDITLRCPDKSVQTRRLDMQVYRRSVTIDAV